MLVRDGEGSIVINENDKLQVYVLNENGKKQKTDAGEYITEYIDFNGQVVLGNTVETAEMKFEIPKTFADNSEIPGYFYSESYEGDIYFTYYDENIDKNQKEYYLREQIRVIQEDLGEDGDSEIDEYERRIKEAKLPEEVEKKLLKENSEKLLSVVDFLLEKESMTGEQFEAIMKGEEAGESSATAMFDGFAEE
mgnify:CR=1 FL=1